MNRKSKDAIFVGGVLFTCLLLAATGCGPVRYRVSHTREGRIPDPVHAQALASEQEGAVDREEVLAAVEEFLKHTEGYQLQEPARTPAEKVAASDAVTPGAEQEPNEPAEMVTVTGDTARLHDQAFANTQVVLTGAPSDQKLPAPPIVESVTVRSVEPVALPAKDEALAKTTNQPLDMQAEEGPITVDRFLNHLASQAEKTGDFDSEWRVRLARLALGRDVAIPEIPSKLSPAARSILDAVLMVVEAARSAARDPLSPGGEAIHNAEQLLHVLADRADPIVSAIALCRRVVTFGVYDEMPETTFLAGRPNQTIVYCEVRNFRSEQTNDGTYRTALATRLEVLTTDGRSVWQHEESDIPDLCRRRRTDFFIAQRVTLPATLPAGQYVLKVLVEDKLSGKANEATHSFTINGPASVASSG